MLIRAISDPRFPVLNDNGTLMFYPMRKVKQIPSGWSRPSLSVASFTVGIAVATLWVSSHVGSRSQYRLMSLFGKQFSVNFVAGKFQVLTPPAYPTAKTREACEQAVSCINNDQVAWSIYPEKGKIKFFDDPYLRDGAPSIAVYVDFVANGGTEIRRELLNALGDPDQFVVAHFLLTHLSDRQYDSFATEFARHQQVSVAGCTSVGRGDFDGLTIVYRAGWSFMPNDNPEDPYQRVENFKSFNLEQRRPLLTQWRKRLDVKVAEVRYWQVVAVCLALPLVRACGLVWSSRLGKARRRRGACAYCGYDLRGSAGRCPECGSSFGGPEEAERPSRFFRPARSVLLGIVVGISSGCVLEFFLYRDAHSIAVARANDSLIARALDDHMGTDKSRARLVEIGGALKRFEAAHDGDGPKTLHELVSAHELANDNQLLCPRPNFHYVYRPYGRDAPRHFKVIYEVPSVPEVQADRVGINVLHKNGNIYLWAHDDAKQLLSEREPNQPEGK